MVIKFIVVSLIVEKFIIVIINFIFIKINEIINLIVIMNFKMLTRIMIKIYCIKIIIENLIEIVRIKIIKSD